MASFFIITTQNVYTLDTGDYFRVLHPVVTEDLPTMWNNTRAGVLHFHFRHSFLPIREAFQNCPSSYTLITYITAKILKPFSSAFHLHLVAIGWKIGFFISVVSLYKTITGLHRLSLYSVLVFVLASVFLVSSSNMAFLTSFYAEQLSLIAIIWIVNYFADNGKHKIAGYGMLLSCLILSTAKNQYFYIPALIIVLVSLMRQTGPFSRFSLMLALGFIQLVAIIFVAVSPTTALNKYHATYFGSYLWLKNNNRDLSGILNKDCIGIDAWGARFDMNEGAVDTTMYTNCYEMNKQVSFLGSLSVLKRNPDLIYRLPMDEAIYEQMDYNYFHVFKSNRILTDAKQGQGLYSKLTYLKDYLFRRLKLPIMFSLLLLGGILLKVERKWSLVLLVLAGISVSQFYVAFIGEGYRDFGKHVFLLNYCLDVFLFSLVAIIGRKGMTYWTFKSNGSQ
jgi:hypothetical protein